jgi:hypothetical protein
MGELKVAHVKPKGTIRAKIDEFPFDDLGKPGLAIGGETHKFVFPGVDPKPAVDGEGTVEQSQ